LQVYSSRDQMALYRVCAEADTWPAVLPFDSRDNTWYTGWGCHHKSPVQVRKPSKTTRPPQYMTVVPDIPEPIRDEPANVVMVTVDIREGASKEYCKAADMCNPYREAFAERNGYRLITITDKGDHAHPAWAKLETGRIMRETDCDVALFVDGGDVLIAPWAVSPVRYTPCVGIAALNTPYWIPYAQRWPFDHDVYYQEVRQAGNDIKPRYDAYINSGVMVINRDAVGLFDAPTKEVNDGRAYEQTWLHAMASRYPLHNLSRLWNWAHLAMYLFLPVAMYDKRIQFVHATGNPQERITNLQCVIDAWSKQDGNRPDEALQDWREAPQGITGMVHRGRVPPFFDRSRYRTR